MAELYQAYGGLNESSYAPSNNYYEERQEQHYQEPIKQIQKPIVQQAPPVQQNPIQQQAQAVQQIQNKSEYSSPMPGFVPATKNVEPQPDVSYSFGDRMILKRGEVIKLFTFSLVIVLAIALEKIGTYYLTKYLSDNVFSELQEFVLRLTYPVVVFLIIWLIKSM